MDPNHAYNAGYNYPPNNTNNYAPPQFQGNPYSQHPPPPPPITSQSYYQLSYPQPQAVPQNYPIYYQNQGHHQPQPYQPPFQQPPQFYYQHPPQPQQRPDILPPESTIEVTVPRHSSHSSHSSSAKPHPYQPPPNYPPQPQLQSQAQISSPSYHQTPQPLPQPQNHHHQQQQQRYVSQQSPANLMQSPQPKVVVEVPKPPKIPDQPVKDNMRRPSTTKTAPAQTPRTIPHIPNRVLQTVEVNVKPPQMSSKPPAPRDSPLDTNGPEPDYPSLLCVLADDYLDEARKHSALTETYYDLISKAVGCLESVLANFKLPPLREAQIALRYARILYDETENYDEAETTLTKSIELCERHKFIDLKYEMQLLLSKVLYESKPKAAVRDIQRMIEDIEAYRHTIWLYVFRFQLAMFSLASSAPGDIHGAAVQLEKIAVLARQNSDVAVLAFAATLEALLHLSSSSHEAVTATQTALAKARAMQLNPDVESNPQMTVLTEFIDLACSIRESNIAQTESKRKIMHEVLFKSVSHSNWRDDGLIYLPVSKRSIAGIQLQANKHIIERSGKYFLVFSWLGKEDIDALGYLFSADSSAYKNGADGGKAEKFAKEGLSLVRGWAKPAFTAGYRQFQRVSSFQKLLEAEFLLLQSFLQCAKGLWQAANESLCEASSISEALGDTLPVNMKHAILYLRGIMFQGTGDLNAALQIYQSPLFNLQQQSSSANAAKASNQITSSHFADSDVTRNFSILALMNSAFIIQAPNHPQHNRLSSFIKALDAAVQSCGNKYIQAHFSLLISVLSGTTLTVKQYLKSAMEAGKAIGSAQTTALSLIYMQEKLFKGVVDDQALKCAKAASHQTRRWGEPLWTHVAASLEAQALEINGLEADARRRRQEAEAVFETLPDGVKHGAGPAS